jgi:hypothetical protein
MPELREECNVSKLKIRRIDAGGFELDKRCYLPFEVTDACPECGKKVTRDLSESYLSYPTIGESEEIAFYHDEEADEQGGDDVRHEWSRYVVIGITLKEAP